MKKEVLIEQEKKRRREKNIKIAITCIIIVLLSALAIWLVFKYDVGSNLDNSKSGETVELTKPDKYQDVEQNPIVTMEMSDGAIIKMELYPQIAPMTVENFIYLIEQGFYDGLTFHRVVPSFMAQGGDPSGDGSGGPGYTIIGEFSGNGFENNISHEVGVVPMARSQGNDTAGSQFFIVTGKDAHESLDGNYAAFGKVIEGMENVYNIVNVPVETDYSDDVKALIDELNKATSQEEANKIVEEKYTDNGVYAKYLRESSALSEGGSIPIDPPVIKSMTVETFGVEYDVPTKL